MQYAGSQFIAWQENVARNIKVIPSLKQGENTLVIIQLK